jgi:lipopolysaccharide transport system ATP-binding protein
MSSKKEIAVSARGLSKAYTIAHEQQKHSTLAETLLQRVRNPFHRVQSETFWALKDISFDINKGSIVGIIGRNGAGKSTLLKILSRITEPTTGEINLFGRIGSLLEVGTGFHPELTGRENIFLNGAILGMSKSEIRRQFDAIVDFAGVEKFLDTPVKRYSSGMYVRLAFAVAAHLEPEILIVDEVLAVGDAEFQKKCLGKMEDVAKREGRTVLFVSHNMNAVEELCNRIIMLKGGSIVADTLDVRAGVINYLTGGIDKSNAAEWVNDEKGTGKALFTAERIVICDGAGRPMPQPMLNDAEAWFQIEGTINEYNPMLTIGCAVFDERGQVLFWSYATDRAQNDWPSIEQGRIKLRCPFPKRLLNEGSYTLHLIASIHFRAWLLEPGSNSPFVHFEIAGGLSDSPYWMNRRPGILAPVLPWASLDPSN